MPQYGESFAQVVERCKDLIHYVKQHYNNDQRIAIVTHSTIMEILKALAENKPWYAYLAQAKDFHGYTVIEI